MIAKRQSLMRLLSAIILCLGASVAAATPQIEQWRTSKGAGVYFVAVPQLPMVDIRVIFDAGSARDGGLPGIAMMTNGMLTEGAGGRSADAIAAHFEGLGAQLGNGALRDMAWVNLRSLSAERYLQPAVEVLADILARPDFPVAAFERERQRLRVGLQAKLQSPGRIADEVFYAKVYGDHPYAHPPEGDLESAQQLTIGALEAFHRRYYVGANAIVVIVGDLDRAGAEALAEQLTRGLEAGVHAPDLPPVPALAEARTERLSHPSAQSHIVMGQPGMQRQDEDYFALYVANFILGGSGLVSRLAEVIREEHGLAYSVYSYFRPMRRKGPFQMGLQTRGDQAEQALSLLREELQRYIAEGPTEEEVAAAKQSIIGGFPLRIDGNREIAEYLGMIAFYGLPLDYLDRFNERIDRLDRAAIHRAFRERIDPDRMVTVIVGGAG